MGLYTAFLFCAVISEAVAAIPVIIDTDVGFGNDDLAAVATALQRKELEIKLIVTATGNTTERARILAKFLHMVGREDITIGIGIPTDKDPILLSDWADNFSLESYKGEVLSDGVEAMASIIRSSERQVSIMAIAPANNIQSFLERFPELIPKANVWAMSGSIYRGYSNSSTPAPEWNVEYCPECARMMYEAPWSVTITPLDTCGVLSLKNQSFALVLKSMGIIALAFNSVSLFCAFKTPFPIHEGTNVLFDAAAPLMMITESRFLEYEELPIYVTDEGMTIISEEKGTQTNVALYWKENGLPQGQMWLAETLNTE